MYALKKNNIKIHTFEPHIRKSCEIYKRIEEKKKPKKNSRKLLSERTKETNKKNKNLIEIPN